MVSCLPLSSFAFVYVIPMLLRCRWNFSPPDCTTTGRREVTCALVTVVSASTEPIPVVVVMPVVNIITES